jgi:SAM-dependent methyltransferase
LRLLVLYPELRPHLELLAACLEAYPELLAGKRDHMAVMFPRGSLARVQGIYRGDGALDFHHRLVAESVRTRVESLLREQSDRRVQIVEVGGGTGGTTAFVLAALAEYGDSQRYVVTDVSPGFTAAARGRFASTYPVVEYALYDIERPESFTAAASGSVDVVIGSNVFHAAERLADALSGALLLLRPGGTLVLYEGTRVQPFVTATFGLTTGWWKHDGHGRLPHSPLLGEADWATMLSRCGLGTPVVLGLPGLDSERRAQAVFVSRKLARAQAIGSAVPSVAPPTRRATARDGSQAPVFDYVTWVMAEVLKNDLDSFALDETFEAFGVDSLVGQEITARFEADLGPLPSTMLFEYPTIRELAGYLATTHGERLHARLAPLASKPEAESGPDPLWNATGPGRR